METTKPKKSAPKKSAVPKEEKNPNIITVDLTKEEPKMDKTVTVITPEDSAFATNTERVEQFSQTGNIVYGEAATPARPATPFTKGDRIRNQKGGFQCICCDDEIAVFSPFKGGKVSHRDMIVYPNKWETVPDDYVKVNMSAE